MEIIGPWFAAPPAGHGGACNGFFVRAEGRDSGVLLDCGPGTVARLQERRLTEKVDAIVLSHTHPDHISDLVQFANLLGVMDALGMPSRTEPIDLYVPVDDGLETLSALDGVWHGAGREPFGGKFRIVEYAETDTPRVVGLGISFQRTSHARPCYAMRISDPVSTAVYTADTGYSEDVISHAGDADLMLCEATLLDPDPRWTGQHGHLTGEMAGRMATGAGAGHLVLTHLGPDTEINAENLRRAREVSTAPVTLAEEGAVYDLSRGSEPGKPPQR